MAIKQIPEFIVTTYERPEAHEIQFNELFKLKINITSIMLLWDFNSYYVNVDEGYFIINGGRRVQPTVIGKLSDRELEYARRSRVDLELGSDDLVDAPDAQVSYLFGITGTYEHEKKSVLLHIAEDGSVWGWKDHR